MSITAPTDISGCNLWVKSGTGLFDATSGGSAVADGGAIARWEDQSGNSNHLTQATTANRPKYDAGSDRVCGETGADEYFTLPAGYNSNSRSFTAFMIVEFQTLRRDYIAGNVATEWLFYNGTNFGIDYSGAVDGKLTLYDGAVKTTATYVPTSLAVIVIACGATGVNVYINDDTDTLAALTAGNANGGSFMGFPSGGFPTQGRYREAAFFNRQVSGSEAASLIAYGKTRGVASSLSTVVTLDGDSRTYGFGAIENKNWEKQGTWPANTQRYNTAETGITLATLLSTRASRVDVLKRAGKTNKLAVWAGTNDFASGTSAATTYSNLQSYISGAKTAGYGTVIAFTDPPNTNLTGGQETARQSFNTSVRSGFADTTLGADQLIDLAADPDLGTWNGTYYFDVAHQNAAGQAIIAKHAAPHFAATGFTTSGTSGTVTVSIAPGGEFRAVQTVILSASAGTITAIAAGGTITNNGTGTVTVKPAKGATSFTYTVSTPATVTYNNGQGWANPPATIYASVSLSASPSTIERGVATTVTVTYTGATPAAGTPITTNHGSLGSQTVGASTVSFQVTDTTAETVTLTDTASGLTVTITVSDTIFPDAPTQFTGGVDLAYHATFNWTASTAADLAGYSVYSKRDGGAETPFAVPGGGLIQTNTFATTLVANHTYVCRVASVDSSGNVTFNLTTVTLDTHPPPSYTHGKVSKGRFKQCPANTKQLG